MSIDDSDRMTKQDKEDMAILEELVRETMPDDNTFFIVTPDDQNLINYHLLTKLQGVYRSRWFVGVSLEDDAAGPKGYRFFSIVELQNTEQSAMRHEPIEPKALTTLETAVHENLTEAIDLLRARRNLLVDTVRSPEKLLGAHKRLVETLQQFYVELIKDDTDTADMMLDAAHITGLCAEWKAQIDNHTPAEEGKENDSERPNQKAAGDATG